MFIFSLDSSSPPAEATACLCCVAMRAMCSPDCPPIPCCLSKRTGAFRCAWAAAETPFADFGSPGRNDAHRQRSLRQCVVSGDKHAAMTRSVLGRTSIFGARSEPVSRTCRKVPARRMDQVQEARASQHPVKLWEFASKLDSRNISIFHPRHVVFPCRRATSARCQLWCLS